MSAPRQIEHLFRHEYGRMIAVLTRRMGFQHIEPIEDAVQSALMRAMQTWGEDTPDNPIAWIYRVAHNHLLDEFRKSARHHEILSEVGDQHLPQFSEMPDHLDENGIKDDLLRLLFICCDDNIPTESQLVIALKIICGFNVREIAYRLFASEAKIYKRLQRAKERLRKQHGMPVELSEETMVSRLPTVYKILYLLFTEGYLSVHTEHAIRRELCDEAIRLTNTLVDHPIGHTPEGFALLALMHLQMARFDARQDASGGLLLLEEQDRSKWDLHQIQTGLWYLAQSAEGNRYSRYHAEAGIAAEHCMAPSFQETRWEKIVANYELLENIAPSLLHRVNRAVAVSVWQGPLAGLGILEKDEPPSWLSDSYIWASVLADLHHRCGHADKARHYRDTALKLAPNQAVRDLLQRRLRMTAGLTRV